MANCYSCKVLLEMDNSSEEHIINNSIGGRLKSRGLLCIRCNSKFGETIDAELEAQIGMFTDLLGIKRERQKKRVKIALRSEEGEVKYVGVKMKPHARLTVKLSEEKEVVLHVEDSEFDKLKTTKEKELSKKSKVDFVAYTELPDKTKYHIQNNLSNTAGEIFFGGDDFFRAIIKISLNYYLSKGYDVGHCADVISVINGERKNDLAYFYFPNPLMYEVHDLKEGEVSHIIHIKGIPERKILYAYVELFNMKNVLIKYNMNYEGPEINDTYAYDLLNGMEMSKDVKIRLGRHHFEILGLISMDTERWHVKKYNRIGKIIEKRQLL